MLTPYLKTVIRRKMQYNVVLTVSRDFFPTSTKSKAGVSNLNLYEGQILTKCELAGSISKKMSLKAA